MDIFFTVLLIISVVVALAFRYYPRRKKVNKPEYVGMQELGFTEVALPDATLKRNVTQLHHKYEGQKLTLQDVFQTEQGGQNYYLFDILDEAGKEPVLITQDMIAIISSQFNLPRLVVITRPKTSGGLGSMADRFMMNIADWEKNEQGLKFINFDDVPSLNSQFLFFSPDPVRAKEFILNVLMKYLVDLPQKFVIDLFADTFTIVQSAPDRSIPRRERIQLTLAKAVELNQILLG
jgi:hypothetical protein